VRLDLDSIDWASLTHAYGSAEDVPGLIGDPRSSDAEVRKAAMDELYSNIYHQGTRYEARAYAVPFLLELMADPTTPARHEIIQLLSCLATGYTPYYVTAGGFPIAEIRNEVAQVLGRPGAAGRKRQTAGTRSLGTRDRIRPRPPPTPAATRTGPATPGRRAPSASC
jgi:hypothetical protein